MTALPAHSGGARATRDDWLELGVSLLARRGVEAVTVLDLSQRLGVSRSSFYWHFRDRNGLIDALLQRWDDLNARSIVKQAETPARTVVEAVLNVFRSGSTRRCSARASTWRCANGRIAPSPYASGSAVRTPRA